MAHALNQRGLIAIPTKMVDGVSVINGDQVFPTMVSSLLPAGLRGLVVGGLLAALMSSLSSLFNSSAALFTVDIYEKLRPGQSEKQLVKVGRMATGVVVVLGLMWIPVMPLISEGGLYQYLQSVQGYLAPPITAVFLLGLFWRRANSYGSTWTLSIGFALGLFKLTVQAFFGAGKIEDPQALAWLGDFNFLYFTGVLFVISTGVMVIVSLMTAPPPPEKLLGLTYGSLSEEQVADSRAGWGWIEVSLTLVVLGLVAGVYGYFSFWLR